jgi:phenylpropionate dioxygenase-like ring-hydroxylating dioxygenase large terminal subunit
LDTGVLYCRLQSDKSFITSNTRPVEIVARAADWPQKRDQSRKKCLKTDDHEEIKSDLFWWQKNGNQTKKRFKIKGGGETVWIHRSKNSSSGFFLIRIPSPHFKFHIEFFTFKRTLNVFPWFPESKANRLDEINLAGLASTKVLDVLHMYVRPPM